MTHDESIPFCRAVKPDLPFVGERALKVVFPDGRQIVVIGHIHGERQVHVFSDSYVRLTLPSLPDSSFFEWLNEIFVELKRPLSGAGYLDLAESDNPVQKLMAGQDTLLHQKENLKFILGALKQLQKNNPIEFIGLEAPSTRLDSIKKSTLLGMTRLEKEYVLRTKGATEGAMSVPQFEDLLLGGSQVEFYLLYRFPELLERAPLIGTVPEPTNKAVSPQEYRTKTRDLFNLLMTQWVHHQQRNIVSSFFNENDELNRAESFDTLLRFLNDMKFQSIYTPEQFQYRLVQIENIHPSFRGPILNQILEDQEILFNADYEKNSGVAKALVAQKKSGIQFIGLAHLSAVAAALEAECAKETP